MKTSDSKQLKPVTVPRRLLPLVGKAKKYIALTVLFRWLELVGSVGAVTALAFCCSTDGSKLFLPAFCFPGSRFLPGRFFCVFFASGWVRNFPSGRRCK